MCNNLDYKKKADGVLDTLVERGYIEKRKCPVYDNIIYYIERYFDYNDYVSAEYIKDTVKEYYSIDNNLESLYDFVYGSIMDSYVLYEGVMDYVDDCVIEELSHDLGMTKNEIVDIIIDNVSLEYDIDELLKKTTLNINLIPYVYDEANQEYTSVTDGNFENTGLNMFSKKYNGRSVDDILKSYKENKELSEEEHELIIELNNIINTFSTFSIFINMSAYDYLIYESYKHIIKPSIVIHDANAGIVDYFTGGGSLRNMRIKKDIVFDYDEIKLDINGIYYYSTNEIYGGIDYSSSISFIHDINEDNIMKIIETDYSLQTNLYEFCLNKYFNEDNPSKLEDLTKEMLVNEIPDFIFYEKSKNKNR